jgi:hypothetical protein
MVMNRWTETHHPVIVVVFERLFHRLGTSKREILGGVVAPEAFPRACSHLNLV